MRLRLEPPRQNGAHDRQAEPTSAVRLPSRTGSARSAFRRGARLASLPLGFAGRATLGPGPPARRRAGRAGERAAAAARGRAAVPGPRRPQGRGDEVRPGAEPVRVGAARGHRRPVPGPAVAAAGLRPADADLAGARRAGPRARARLAQPVHRLQTRCPRPPPRSGRCTGRPGPTAATVAVKVQYPGADEALRSDLKQIGRLSKVISPLAGGMDVERAGRRADRPGQRGARLHPRGRRPAAGRRGFAGSAEFFVPHVLAGHVEGDGQRVGRGRPAVHRRRTCPDDGAQRDRAALRAVPVRRTEHGRAAARRPAPRQLQDHPRRPARRRRLRAGRPAARRAAAGDGPDPADRAAAATRT